MSIETLLQELTAALTETNRLQAESNDIGRQSLANSHALMRAQGIQIPAESPAAFPPPPAVSTGVDNKAVEGTVIPANGPAAAPQARGAPGFQPVPGAVPPPASQPLDKRGMYDLMLQTYTALEQTKRGAEVGQLMSQYGAQHIDNLDPAHYPAFQAALEAKLAEVS